MVKRKSIKSKQQETDTTYFLKITLYLILGSQWVRIESLPDWSLPIPVGLFIGLLFASHDHFKIDRKIEYAILLLSAFIGFWLPMGLIVDV